MADHKFKRFSKDLGGAVFISTLVAIVSYSSVFHSIFFSDTLLICQFIGLSICLSVMIGKKIAEKNNIPILIETIGGTGMGLFFGGALSWILLSTFYGMGFSYFIEYIFTKIIIWGLAFGVPAIYLLFFRRKIVESKKIIQQEKIKRLTIEKEATITSLRLLQAQIEPHFLFNTLANIISLFDINVETAKKMLIDFNEYLRICLQRTRQEMITLTQELDLVRQYLEIFKIRMGKRLSYEIHDYTKLPDIDFPPLIIQPLVENSIKYGIEPKIDGGHITITCQILENMLKISIADTGQGLDENANQAGVGINNVSQRLENIYGDQAILTIKENHPIGVKITIKVPL